MDGMDGMEDDVRDGFLTIICPVCKATDPDCPACEGNGEVIVPIEMCGDCGDCTLCTTKEP